eukprot:5859437-Alexandrium_andersonii.AAC.1
MCIRDSSPLRPLSGPLRPIPDAARAGPRPRRVGGDGGGRRRPSPPFPRGGQCADQCVACHA